MEIKVLGTGCAKCSELERAVREAIAEAGLEATVEHVSDFEEIVSYGVMATPALVVDGQLRLSGRVPRAADLIKVLQRPASESGTGGCGCGSGCC